MIVPDVSTEEAQKVFPDDIDTVKMPSGKEYVRSVYKYWDYGKLDRFPTRNQSSVLLLPLVWDFTTGA